jgi:hypothetical protein
VLWILSLAAAALLIPPLIRSFLAGLSSRSLVSLDWAGYVVVSDSENPQPLVTGVNASWTVPQVTASQQNSFSATWIGIGGHLDNTLIQVGTEQDCVNSGRTYSAWYELVPRDVVTISTISVSPEDRMTASISLVDSGTSTWSVEIEDNTTGQTFKNNFFYDSSRLSAEWIVERPTVGRSLGALANFGSITFTNSSAEMNATSKPIRCFPFVQVVLYNRQNKPLVTVSALDADGSSFSISCLNSVTTMNTLEAPSSYASIALARPYFTVVVILKVNDIQSHFKVKSEARAGFFLGSPGHTAPTFSFKSISNPVLHSSKSISS